MHDWSNRVLYLDGEALVIDKPAGLAVHPGPSTRHSLEAHLEELRFGFHRPPSPVHRLDRDTSGCLLLARNSKAHRRYSKAFEQGQVNKTYLAILSGIPSTGEGEIDLPLAKISSREIGWRMRGDPAGKPALTRWRVLAARLGRALVEFVPMTGRTHQLRVHAAEGLGIPIVGDPVYGGPSAVGQGDGAIRLHAWSLRLGRNGKPAIEARAPLPPVFLEAGFDLPVDPEPIEAGGDWDGRER